MRKNYYPNAIVVQMRPRLPENSNVAILDRPMTSDQSARHQPHILDFGTRTVREAFIEIRTANAREDLVTVIEILSPTNKEPGPGREEYIRKQQDVMGSFVHLVEIDLLREEPYVLAPPLERRRLAG